MTLQYILKDGKPVLEPDLTKWGKWFQTTKDRIVKKDVKNDVKISTVFLGLDHNFGGGSTAAMGNNGIRRTA